MIHSLKELLKDNASLNIVSYINEQISALLGIELKNHKLYELSCTSHCFVKIDDKLTILGIIIITSKSFLLDGVVFVVESLSSKEDDKIVEQSLLMKGLNHIYNISPNNNKMISFIGNERIQKEVLEAFGFCHSQGIMTKI